MKKTHNHFWTFLVFGLLALSAKIARADSPSAPASPTPPSYEKIEMPVGHVFIAPQGFDDNDNIEFVIDGVFPNGCYQVASDSTQVDAANKHVITHLFANHRTDGPCGNAAATLPASLLAAVPYTLEVSVGQLPAGMWQITYSRPNLPDGVRPFQVDRAKVASIDDVPYAAISSVWIPDSVRGDLPVTAELIGSLTSSCSFLQPEVLVNQIDDVFVVRQSLGFKANVLCSLVMLPFQKTIQLGTPGAGRFLIHARSMNGRAVNRVFSGITLDP